MTSDAKIGLLLGLVVIFIIAFVINGLPRFQNGTDSNEPALDKNFVQDNPIGDRERSAPGVIEAAAGEMPSNPASGGDVAANDAHYDTPWSDEHSIGEADRSGETGTLPGLQEQVIEQASDWPPHTSNIEPQQDSQVANNTQGQEEIRSYMNLPFGSQDTGEPQLTILSNENQSQRGTLPSTRSLTRGGSAPQESQIQTAQLSQTNPPAPAGQNAWPKTYVIKEGDNNLNKIAKKFYGEQEGNRLVNITRIFDANKSTMKTADKIFVGQTITIPQPAAALVPQPAAVLKAGMFQPASSVGGGVIKQETAAPIQDTGRWYEVKEDDNLWKIAAEQLGKGTRFDEINKLNTDILKSGTKLKPGMKIRLPAQ